MAVDIYTDGACVPNPGPGGWGVVLRFGEHERELCGGEAGETTNNRMELTAPIEALETLTRRMPVRIHTDSTYVRDGITKWVAGWRANGWVTTARTPVRNVDLWQRLETAVGEHDVEWFWVKGHSGHPENERADRLALAGLRRSLAEAGLPPLPEKQPDDKPARRKRTGTAEPVLSPTGERCRATTKRGTRCPVTARPSGLCHVHDPAVQCGATKRDGGTCGIATGGGPCAHHGG